MSPRPPIGSTRLDQSIDSLGFVSPEVAQFAPSAMLFNITEEAADH